MAICTRMRNFAHPPWGPRRQQSPMCKFACRVEPRAPLAADDRRNHALPESLTQEFRPWADFRQQTQRCKFAEGDHRANRSCLAHWSCQLASSGSFVPTTRKPANLPDSTSLMSPAMCGPPSANLQKVRLGTPPDLHCPALPAPIGGPCHVPEQTCSGA